MSSKNNVEIDEESLKSSVAEVLRRIREEEQPEELNVYRSLFRKNVPFFLRSYFGAYLLRQLMSKGPGRRKINTLTIFVSIGKNRRVFPRDLVLLLSSAGKISKSDIGDIKILDNYSFIEVDEKVATALIERMDGMTYRGRRLTVNYAKKRTSEELSSAEDDHPDHQESVMETVD